MAVWSHTGANVNIDPVERAGVGMRIASKAAKLLSSPRTSVAVKSVAASALTQKVRADKSKGK